MLVLDTDHLSSFGYPSVASERLGARLAAANQDVATTAVCCDEQLSGVLAAIHRVIDPFRQIIAYGELVERIDFLAGFTLLPWDQDSAGRFVQFRKDRVRWMRMWVRAERRQPWLLVRVPVLSQPDWLPASTSDKMARDRGYSKLRSS